MSTRQSLYRMIKFDMVLEEVGGPKFKLNCNHHPSVHGFTYLCEVLLVVYTRIFIPLILRESKFHHQASFSLTQLHFLVSQRSL